MADDYDALKVKYNSKVEAEIKSFLPIIGNEIPNKLLTDFDAVDEAAVIASTGTGAGSYDYIKNIRGRSCYKAALDTGENLTITYTPASAVNLLSLASSSNNYAETKQTGKYGDDQDKLFLIWQWLAVGSSTVDVNIKVYSSDTDYAELKATYQSAITAASGWDKSQVGMNDTYFTYNASFVDASWEAVTKIQIIFDNSGGSTDDIYLQGLWVGLPKVNSRLEGAGTDPVITNAYFPDVDDTNAIFVSWLLGNDANAGTARNAPKKTVTDAITDAMSGSKDFVVIMDSETYKPIKADYTDFGIKETLTYAITIIADFIETPVLSAKPGNLNKDRIGARKYYRNAYYINDGGAGTTITVGAAGADQTTIAAAYAAASNGDCIEIIDSGTYDEALNTAVGKGVTIQALAGQKPIWKNTGANTIVNVIHAVTLKFYGIIFEGNASGSDVLIDITNLSSPVIIKDCAFQGVDGTYVESVFGLTIENCTFFTEHSNDFCLDITQSATGSFYLLNNTARLQGSSYFIRARRAGALDIDIYAYYNDGLTGPAAGGFFYWFADSGTGATYTNVYFIYNRIQLKVVFSHINSLISENSYIVNNYFEMYQTTAIQISSATSATASTYYISSNFFINRVSQNAQAINVIASTANLHIYINKNIIMGSDFSFLSGVVMSAICTIEEFESNLFYKCDRDATSYGAFFTNQAVVASYNFYISCYYGVYENGTGSYAESTGIFYDNNTNTSGNVNIVGSSTSDPKFVSYDDLRLGWLIDSPIDETIARRNFGGALISATVTAAETLGLKFLKFEGHYGKTGADTVDVITNIQYCYFTDFAKALCSVDAQIHSLNCKYINNSIALLIATDTISDTSNVKYNILNENDMGLLFRSAVDFDYNTILNSSYGMYGRFSGFYADDEYISAYSNITNSIITGSLNYDYYYTLPTDYCIIGTRYYDSLAKTDINYKNTVGDNDITSSPKLDTAYFYPNNIYEGYELVSPAYNAASDSGNNIGARNEIHITSAPSASDYAFPLEINNPQFLSFELRPINLEEITTVDGSYKAYSDVDMYILNFSWDSVASGGKITPTMKTIIEYMFKTYWLIAISTDDGVSYTYYKVDKSSSLNFELQLFKNPTRPYGNTALFLRAMPDAFDIADYTVEIGMDE